MSDTKKDPTEAALETIAANQDKLAKRLEALESAGKSISIKKPEAPKAELPVVKIEGKSYRFKVAQWIGKDRVIVRAADIADDKEAVALLLAEKPHYLTKI